MTLRQREPREECPAFLAFVRKHRCCACGAAAPSQAAHVRMGSASHGERNFGVGERPHDRRAVPLCAYCHLDGPEAQHKIGEEKFWRIHNLDPFAIAANLWALFVSEHGEPRIIVHKPRARKTTRSIGFPKSRSQVKQIPKRPLRSANHWPLRSRKLGGKR